MQGAAALAKPKLGVSVAEQMASADLSAPNPNSHVTVNHHLNVYKEFVLLDICIVISMLQYKR